MPVFYFNIVCGTETVRDPEGTQLPDLDAARIEAIADARMLMSQAMLRGDDLSNRRVEICDEIGTIVLAVPFAQAMRLRD